MKDMNKVLETLKEDYALRASLKRKHLNVQDELEDEIEDLEQSLITSKIIPELDQYVKTLLRDLECEVYLAIKKDTNGDVEVADELSIIPTNTTQQKAKPLVQPAIQPTIPSGAIIITPSNINDTIKRDLRITVNGRVFQERNAIQTFIEALKYIGLIKLPKLVLCLWDITLLILANVQTKDILGRKRWDNIMSIPIFLMVRN